MQLRTTVIAARASRKDGADGLTGDDALPWLGHVSDRPVSEPRASIAGVDVLLREDDRLSCH